MKGFILTLLILLCKPVRADFSRQECLNVDYSHRFGPVRDQDGHGYCWAFVASALAEESFCKLNRVNCGKSVSPLDISRCDWTLATESEGGSFQGALYCGMESGVCNESHAPYDALRSWGCTMRQLIVFRSNRCDRDILKGLYTEWEQAENRCEQDGVISSQERQNLQRIQARLIEDLRARVPARLLQGRNVSELFTGSASADNFLRRTLIGKSCEENRRRIPGSRIDSVPDSAQFSRGAIRQNLNAILQGLSRNSSVAIGVDLGRTKLNTVLGGLVTAYGKDSNHGLVITGMRWNRQASKCEVNLRNSWGVGADFTGWTKVSDIEGGLKYSSYIQ